MKTAALCLLLALGAAPASAQVGPLDTTADTELQRVGAPKRVWYSGDTHAHIQPYFGIPLPPDLTVEELFELQKAAGIDVGCCLIWNSPGTNGVPGFLQDYAPLVTGQEDPISQGDPDHVFQFDVEVSRFNASQFGHHIGLHLNDAFFPTDNLYPAPNLDFFKAQPDAVVGHAHIRWPKDLQYPNYADPRLPFMAPMDIAMGKCDFLETIGAEVEQSNLTPWYPLYYQILNAGLRVGLSGASDNSPDHIEIGDTRTYALMHPPLTYKKWTQAIKAGRTTIADGRFRFLDLEVDGQPLGSQVELSGPGTVAVRAVMEIADGFSDSGTIKILRNEDIVASQPYAITGGGKVVFETTVTVNDSAWLGARTAEAHTAATYVIVAGEPIVELADATFMRDYCDDLLANLSFFETSIPGVINQHFAITFYISNAKAVFEALVALGSEPLPGVVTYGRADSTVRGPMAIGVSDAPAAGASLGVTCLHAPADADGWILFALQPAPRGVALGDARLYLDPASLVSSFPARSSGGGFVKLPVTLPEQSSGTRLFAQFVWVGEGGRLLASDALDLSIP